MPMEHQFQKRARSGNGKAEDVTAGPSPRQLREIIDSTADFMAFTDSEGRLKFLNAAGRKLTGVQESENVQGTSLADYHAPREAEIISNIGLLRAQQAGGWAVATVLRHKDGREIPVHETIIAHKSAQGRVEGYSVIARDLSESPWREEAPWAGAKLRNLLEAAPGALVVANPRGEIVLVNAQAERWLGATRHELLGKKVAMQIPALRRAPHQDELERQGLAAAVRAYAHSLGTSGKFHVELQSPSDFPRLSRDAERSLYGVLLEAVKYTCQGPPDVAVTIRLRSSPQEIVLELQGETPQTPAGPRSQAETPTAGTNAGLLGMTDSLFQLGGQLEISVSSSSTRIRAALPRIPAAEDPAAETR